eukprot:258824_1
MVKFNKYLWVLIWLLIVIVWSLYSLWMLHLDVTKTKLDSLRIRDPTNHSAVHSYDSSDAKSKSPVAPGVIADPYIISHGASRVNLPYEVSSESNDQKSFVENTVKIRVPENVNVVASSLVENHDSTENWMFRVQNVKSEENKYNIDVKPEPLSRHMYVAPASLTELRGIAESPPMEEQNELNDEKLDVDFNGDLSDLKEHDLPQLEYSDSKTDDQNLTNLKVVSHRVVRKERGAVDLKSIRITDESKPILPRKDGKLKKSNENKKPRKPKRNVKTGQSGPAHTPAIKQGRKNTVVKPKSKHSSVESKALHSLKPGKHSDVLRKSKNKSKSGRSKPVHSPVVKLKSKSSSVESKFRNPKHNLKDDRSKPVHSPVVKEKRKNRVVKSKLKSFHPERGRKHKNNHINPEASLHTQKRKSISPLAASEKHNDISEPKNNFNGYPSNHAKRKRKSNVVKSKPNLTDHSKSVFQRGGTGHRQSKPVSPPVINENPTDNLRKSNNSVKSNPGQSNPAHQRTMKRKQNVAKLKRSKKSKQKSRSRRSKSVYPQGGGEHNYNVTKPIKNPIGPEVEHKSKIDLRTGHPKSVRPAVKKRKRNKNSVESYENSQSGHPKSVRPRVKKRKRNKNSAESNEKSHSDQSIPVQPLVLKRRRKNSPIESKEKPHPGKSNPVQRPVVNRKRSSPIKSKDAYPVQPLVAKQKNNVMRSRKRKSKSRSVKAKSVKKHHNNLIKQKGKPVYQRIVKRERENNFNTGPSNPTHSSVVNNRYLKPKSDKSKAIIPRVLSGKRNDNTIKHNPRSGLSKSAYPVVKPKRNDNVNNSKDSVNSRSSQLQSAFHLPDNERLSVYDNIQYSSEDSEDDDNNQARKPVDYDDIDYSDSSDGDDEIHACDEKTNDEEYPKPLSECLICYKEFDEKRPAFYVKSHPAKGQALLCKDCITNWFKKNGETTCPHCAVELTDIEIEPYGQPEEKTTGNGSGSNARDAEVEWPAITSSEKRKTETFKSARLKMDISNCGNYLLLTPDLPTGLGRIDAIECIVQVYSNHDLFLPKTSYNGPDPPTDCHNPRYISISMILEYPYYDRAQLAIKDYRNGRSPVSVVDVVDVDNFVQIIFKRNMCSDLGLVQLPSELQNIRVVQVPGKSYDFHNCGTGNTEVQRWADKKWYRFTPNRHRDPNRLPFVVEYGTTRWTFSDSRDIKCVPDDPTWRKIETDLCVAVNSLEWLPASPSKHYRDGLTNQFGVECGPDNDTKVYSSEVREWRTNRNPRTIVRVALNSYGKWVFHGNKKCVTRTSHNYQAYDGSNRF